ncbi:hypothetical protein LJR084_007288 [Variovorax sp. LjRoot84]|uniref:hypothetical protein n=1 Tax=Variovorax sp. LjRoot84 TaxID=3342340 RepID=UPI003ECE0D60
MMDITALGSQVAKRRSSRVPSEFGEIPGSIGYLEGLLNQATTLDEKHLMFVLILGECSRASNPEPELHYLRRQLESLPLQPILLASLAYALANIPGSGDEALTRCAEAVALARKENRQVRYSLAWQVRIALILDDYTVLHDALQGLVDDAGKQREEDSAYEFDFVDQIDAARCDAQLLARYEELA